jgi:two-component system chemotaxis sensor kinase CheA
MGAAEEAAATFRQEAADLLERLEQALLDMEDAPANRGLIDTAFRALHTIKGSGAMFGFEEVAAFTHHVETAFDRLRKGEVEPNRALVGLALKAKDHMRSLIERPDEANPEAGEAILEDLAQAIEGQSAAPVAPHPSGDTPTNRQTTWRIRFRLPKDAMATGTNPLLLLDELRGLGDCSVVALTEGIPLLEDMEADACYLAWNVVLTTEQPRSAIDDVFLFVLDDMELTVEEVHPSSRRIGEILVERGDVSSQVIDEVLAEQKPLGELLVGAGHLSEQKVKAALVEQAHLRQASENQTADKSADSIRVSAERLDSLMDRVGELVIAQARLKQLTAISADLHLRSIAEEMERLANELRDTTMGIRMVPIGSLFGRFRRLVRDLATDLGKGVRLTTEGEETELDKTVIERLADPLVHLIRNSIDHGIEQADERAAAGKAAEGEVHLAARHTGAQVWISIRDDGKGLDRARIRARAEEQELIEPGAKLSDAELLQLIFHPGFSTAKKVTSLSGRGVGMDVFKRTIEGLRGVIDVQSQQGLGTEVILKLPLTLAIIDGLLVRVGTGRYVIPLAAVEECVELSVADDVRSIGRSFLNIRGDLVPFLRLRELFLTATPPDPYQKVVIVSTGDRRVGLVVDQVIGDHQTVIKSLSKLHADVASFSGATILGDGSVALILDIPHLIAFGQGSEMRLQAS